MDSPLAMAVKKRRENKTTMPDSEQLLEMILAQVTKMAEHFDTEEKNEIVTTQESHRP